MNEHVERELMALLERPTEEDLPLPEGVFHLVVADGDLTDRAHQKKMTVCGVMLSSSSLPPPCFGEGVEIGDREPRFCPECVEEVLRWRAEGALSAEVGAGDAR